MDRLKFSQFSTKIRDTRLQKISDPKAPPILISLNLEDLRASLFLASSQSQARANPTKMIAYLIMYHQINLTC